jgi:hypothetical protein
MKRVLIALAALPLVALLTHGVALGQDAEYALKGYMPETTGSKWVMKTTGRQGAATTVTYEVAEAREIEGKRAMPILNTDADGNLLRGSLEAVDDETLTLFGSIMVPRGPNNNNAEPIETLYKPAATFPATMKVGDRNEATAKVTRQGQETEIKLSVELAAVETVTVPKGTFEGCLKLVYTTTFGEREMKRTVWYAEGVGMVKTESGGGGGRDGQQRPPRVAELTDYSLAEE